MFASIIPSSLLSQVLAISKAAQKAKAVDIKPSKSIDTMDIEGLLPNKKEINFETLCQEFQRYYKEFDDGFKSLKMKAGGFCYMLFGISGVGKVRASTHPYSVDVTLHVLIGV